MRTQRSFVVYRVDATAQRDLAAGWLVPAPYVPAEGLFLVVQDEGPAGQEGVVQLCECLDVLFTGAAEAQDTAADDRRVAPRRLQRMQRRHPERRVGCPLPAALDHVGGRVAPVNVEACFAQGGEQPSCATAGVEDGAAEVLPVEVELGRVDG